MSIGYACLTVGVPNTQMRTCRKANATKEKLIELINNNLTALEAMMDYNKKNHIHLFRISSDLIPFGSDLEVNPLNWEELFEEEFSRISKKIHKHQIRISVHPGQYTVINSPREDVVRKAFLDLEYHNRLLDALKVDRTHKIILHIGGVYGDKEAAAERFVQQYKNLSDGVKSRLIIENDDRLYTIADVLEISRQTGAPVVYDNLHNFVNPADLTKSDGYWVEQAGKTWKKEDGRQKVHYSQQRESARAGAHTLTTYIEPFLKFYYEVEPYEVDIMLEVKDKNLSAVKAVLATRKNKKISLLEKEWGRYKYLVLEQSPAVYQAVRTLLKDKETYPAVEFYRLIEEALNEEPTRDMRINAADHIWGHLKNKVSESEKKTYQRLRNAYLNEDGSLKRMKNHLNKLAKKYEDQYLIQSLYFDFI